MPDCPKYDAVDLRRNPGFSQPLLKQPSQPLSFSQQSFPVTLTCQNTPSIILLRDPKFLGDFTLLLAELRKLIRGNISDCSPLGNTGSPSVHCYFHRNPTAQSR